MIMIGGERSSGLSPARLGPALFARLASTRPLRRQQPAPDHVEVGEREHREQTRRVLGQTAIAHLGEAPQLLDDAKGMLAAGPGGRTQSVQAAPVLAQPLA